MEVFVMAGKFQNSYENYLLLQRIAPQTRRSYLQAVAAISAFHKLPAARLSNDQIQEYLFHCIQERELAWSSCNVLFCGLKKYYQHYLGRNDSEFSIPPRPRSKQLPMLLSRQEVKDILQAPVNLKHRALLSVVYGSGLRVSEAVHLLPQHIESSRMMIRVEQGKGRKDRYTVLANSSLTVQRDYWGACRPHKWLFFGKDKSLPMPVGTAQKIYYHTKNKAGVTRGRGIHTLRHCFATHALEQGVELYIIKRWMGHTAITTTYNYIHTSPAQLAKVKSPLDDLYQEVTS